MRIIDKSPIDEPCIGKLIEEQCSVGQFFDNCIYLIADEESSFAKKAMSQMEQLLARKEMYYNAYELEVVQHIELRNHPKIKERIEAVREFRFISKKAATRKKAVTSWKPTEPRFVKNSSAIIIPRVSSERRKYIPIGYMVPNTVIADSAYAIYDAPLWLFAIVISAMHMIWSSTFSGRLKTDYRYSAQFCYNTFPFPNLSENQKKALEDSAMRIIEARENHYENTMAQLYDPDKMPDDLRAAHESNDLLVDSLYRRSGFENDSERLQELFRRYREMVNA